MRPPLSDRVMEPEFPRSMALNVKPYSTELLQAASMSVFLLPKEHQDTMNDVETAMRIASGDVEATEKFVRENYAFVYRSLRHLTRHREDAEDLTQQAFIKARVGIESFRGNSELKTWLLRIAFNEYAQWKRRSRHSVMLPTDQSAEDPGYGAFVTGDSLLSALATLPDKQREAIVLHEIEGLSVVQIAKITRSPAGTIKARLFYARRRLRALLEDGTEVKRIEPQEATI